MVLIHTLIQYFILIALLVAGCLFMVSISQQDWMSEEMSMKIPKELMEIYKNQTTAMLPPGSATRKQMEGYFKVFDNADMSVEIKAHCGLKETCFMFNIKGFDDPMRLAIPELRWCLNNDFFTKPQKYGVSEGISMDMFKDEAKALQNSKICMVLAILCVALGIIVVLVKLCKWPQECVIATVILVLISCVCVISALAVVNNNFTYKKKFDRMKSNLQSISSYGGGYGGAYSGRRRRDYDSPSYGGMYPSVVGGGGHRQQQMTQMMMGVIPTMEMKESIGSPLLIVGLGIGLLMLVILLNGVEFFLIRKHGGIEAKYHNVELS